MGVPPCCSLCSAIPFAVSLAGAVVVGIGFLVVWGLS